MALIKPFETPHKVIASYHKLIKASHDMQNQNTELVFAVYASAEARDAGGSILWHEYVQVPFAAMRQDPRVALYELARTDPRGYLNAAESDAVAAPPEPPAINPEFAPA